MIKYRWAGTEGKPLVVLSHSLGANMHFWEPQVQALAKDFQILLYDQRGHGESSAPSGSWSIDDFGHDLISILDHLQLKQVSFCGLSLGGMVGIWLAAHASVRVQNLIIANTTYKIKDKSLLQNRIKTIEERGLSHSADNILRGWFSPNYAGALKPIKEHLLATSDSAYIKTSRAVCEMDLSDYLSAIECPTLVLTGKHDKATPPEWGKELQEAIPGAQLRELETAHMSNLEDPSNFNEVLQGWLST